MKDLINTIKEIQQELEYRLDELPDINQQTKSEQERYNVLINADMMLDDLIHLLKEVKD